MKTYLEIQVPLPPNAPWLHELRRVCRNIPVRWQSGFHHITMAFIDDTPFDIDLCPVFRKHFETASAPVLTFDKIDVFTTTSGSHVIYLTASHIPQSFLELTEAIRKDLEEEGCVMQSEFRLHVTLGRVKDHKVKISALREMIDTVPIPPFILKLVEVDYRVFRGKTIFETRLG